jgi:hypothetical protein
MLKATNINKIKDYIILYTLLDLGYDENYDDFRRLITELDLEQTLKEIKFYWRLENAFINKTNFKLIADEFKEVENVNPQWATSILQTLLELKHYELAMIFATSRDLKLSQQKSIELITYAL